MGFRNSDWNAVPEAASAAPTKATTRDRGSRTFQTMPVSVAVPPGPSRRARSAAVADRSANDSGLAPVGFPSFTTTETPAVFKEKLDRGQPMLILFYDDAQQVTATERAEVDAVMSEYRGLIDLVTFNVGGDVSDPATLAAVTYAKELGVSGTPYVLVVDGGGFITWRIKGYADQASIMREVERATR